MAKNEEKMFPQASQPVLLEGALAVLFAVESVELGWVELGWVVLVQTRLVPLLVTHTRDSSQHRLEGARERDLCL